LGSSRLLNCAATLNIPLVEKPTKFELVMSLRAFEALGVTIA
jgi:hypothetical protein